MYTTLNHLGCLVPKPLSFMIVVYLCTLGKETSVVEYIPKPLPSPFPPLHYACVGVSQVLPVVMKSKPTDMEVCNMLNKIAQGCGLKLAVLYDKFKMDTDFRYLEMATLFYQGLWLMYTCIHSISCYSLSLVMRHFIAKQEMMA